jgi:hypothetical protein
VPIFENAVKKQFLKQLDTAGTLKNFSDSLAALNLQKLAHSSLLKTQVRINPTMAFLIGLS